MSSTGTTPGFPLFGRLPTEIRLRISYTVRERDNDLRNGLTELPRTESLAEFGFAFDLFPLVKVTQTTQLKIPWVNREVYHEHFPDVLQLRRCDGRQAGNAVRFNARFDTIWIDLDSLRALYDYIRPCRRVPGQVTEGGYGPSIVERRRNLTGFDLIQRLMTPLPATPTVDGIEYLRIHLFTGLTESIKMDETPTTVATVAAAYSSARI
ncbi:hypothetical protein BKA61DRAFT_572187 [Leptodontidium sp. MPI-SDFR-AT-0119]|nr:hypothetical protein BKA61DRAFT_572187 [Leptodontidium sp. MPI-SDFR-AT-0119]